MTSVSDVLQKLLKVGDDDIRSPSPSKSGRRSLSARDASRPHRGGLHAGLISAPQNDLRHTLHVGYDGATFGDLSVISQGYLPVETTGMYL